jgi:hypothetical protein
VVSLTPFRFSWTQDRGNGKNPVPSSPCPPLQSIALGAADGSGTLSASVAHARFLELRRGAQVQKFQRCD